ncbi:MAG TPA: hypothetical protein VNW46_18655 [Gemmatimonadaceae bacterium]|nr:hypothetical protein [Gemmatimonadaceae bacterium]
MTDRDTMMLCGGIALAIVGAGMILSNRGVRQLLGGFNPAELLHSAAPSFDRYLKLRAM